MSSYQDNRAAFVEQLRTAQVVVAVDATTGEKLTVYGIEAMERIAGTGVTEKLLVLKVPFDRAAGGLKKLRKLVRHVKGKEEEQGTMHLLLWQGAVQRWHGNSHEGIIFARTESIARFAAKELTKPEKKVSIGRIGSVPGETLDGHIEAAIKDGDLGTWHVTDGEPPLRMTWFPFPADMLAANDLNQQ